jgi:hypothetical protein
MAGIPLKDICHLILVISRHGVTSSRMTVSNSNGLVISFEAKGRILCQHGLYIDVDKTLEMNEKKQVRTIRYSYHAGIEGSPGRPIFRYDNAHRYEGHGDEHHKHQFSDDTGQEIDPPKWIGRANWPHLSDVIEELFSWWESRGRHLGLHDPQSAK